MLGMDDSMQTGVNDLSLDGIPLQHSNSLRESTRPQRAGDAQGAPSGSGLGGILRRSITLHTPRDGSRRQESSSISFYDRDRPYHEFINNTSYPVQYNGKTYPTAEHLYQAHKYFSTRADIAEQLRTIPNASDALKESLQQKQHQRKDWFQVNVGFMDLVLEAKFTQHSALREMLVGTGSRDLVYANSNDSFWGVGNNRRGKNELGKALMRVRSKLQALQPVLPDGPPAVRQVSKPLPLPPRSSSGRPAVEPDRVQDMSTTYGAPIMFYGPNEPYYEFANALPCKVRHGEDEYPTAEHLYQASKFFHSKNPGLADHIRVQPTCYAAIQAARRLLNAQRSDWPKARQPSMEATLKAKFSQHQDLRQMLLSTGDKQLVYANPNDAFWGLGLDGSGMNELGKSLMSLRDALRAQSLGDAGAGPDNDE
ncbi:NADAR family protein [Phanerochaete sordida]|uniref:NADAR family protein n=1 Tax=Phanerochaete sordida TaxID=48140 RepID=A0A9P3LIK5_9APHY|nr:NADAR family protein [Phanerochaete sordida]